MDKQAAYHSERGQNTLVDEQQREINKDQNESPHFLNLSSMKLSDEVDDKIAEFIGPDNMGNLVVGICIPKFETPSKHPITSFRVNVVNETGGGDNSGPILHSPHNMLEAMRSNELDGEIQRSKGITPSNEKWDVFKMPYNLAGVNDPESLNNVKLENELNNVVINMPSDSEQIGDGIYDHANQPIGWDLEMAVEAKEIEHPFKLNFPTREDELLFDQEFGSDATSGYASQEEQLPKRAKNKRRIWWCCPCPIV